MTPAKFLVRFDDVCPTMNWKVWQQIEKPLIDYGILPIMAIVPDNMDETLRVNAADPMFWEQVRVWQARGWTIALHGYQHRYVTNDAGLIGLNPYSEFAGLPEHLQEEKLRKALRIFDEQHVQPSVWVAPAHSFDRGTLRALSRAGIDTISDGFALRPYRDPEGTRWIPQQMWRFRTAPPGIWTVCSHINDWTAKDIARFQAGLLKFKDRIVSVPEVLREYSERRRSILDNVASVVLRVTLHIVRHMSRRDERRLALLKKKESFAATLGSSVEQADS
jgi:predicted deacetylase